MWCRSRVLATVCPPGTRAGHKVRGRPPGEAVTLRQRMQMLDKKDPFYECKTDIGLPFYRKRYCEEHTMRQLQLEKIKSNPELEKLARNHQLRIDLDKVEEEWLRLNGPMQIHKIAEHYGVFKDLYDEGYFIPRVPMKILFDSDDDVLSPVYHGNVIKPAEAKTQPSVTYKCEENTLWTLVLCNPDGHLTEPGKEYVHWFVSNVPGNQVEKGETLVKYMQPTPPKGTGYHRYIFVLYKQSERLDYNISRVTEDCLQERTFSTRDWYSKYQDIITPAGLAFFQSDWDTCLTDFFHNNLNMKEPIYEYDFPERYIKPQELFPLRQPFNLYMDKYRDPKQINKEFFLKKLKADNPFKKPDPPLKYPLVHKPPKDMPSWLRTQERKNKLKWGRINDF